MAPTRPLALTKYDGSELLNASVISLFKHTTYSRSAYLHLNTLKLRKIHSCSDIRKIVKTSIVHLLLLLLLLLIQFKQPTAKLALDIALILSQKPLTKERAVPFIHKMLIPCLDAVKSRTETLQVVLDTAIFFSGQDMSMRIEVKRAGVEGWGSCASA